MKQLKLDIEANAKKSQDEIKQVQDKFTNGDATATAAPSVYIQPPGAATQSFIGQFQDTSAWNQSQMNARNPVTPLSALASGAGAAGQGTQWNVQNLSGMTSAFQ